VGFTYPSGRLGLGSTELEVGPGEVVAILGPNGSGKSTLLRLLATDLSPTRGRLELLGRDASRPDAALRSRIGWVPDRAPHLEALTGWENARFFSELAKARGPRASPPPRGADDRELHGLLEEFELLEAADVPVAEYSFGMRRKLLLAQAFASIPELLVLDEPTVGLDPSAMGTLRGRITGLARDGGAVVLATNEIHQAPFWADRIVLLHRGAIVARGTAPELLERLGHRARIHVHFRGTLVDPPRVEGLEGPEVTEGLLAGWSRTGGGLLPTLVAALLEAGVTIRDIQVREPDLSDLFRELTGEALVDGAQEPGP
jgi:ABC-2 type transport system ATP-binding protein